MDRVIKFRGKIHCSFLKDETDAAECFFGFYAKDEFGNTKIIDETGDFEYVDPKTVGQFTGFVDVDDKEIYEGDIIQNDEHPEIVEYVEMMDGCWSAVNEVEYNTLDWALRHGNFKVIGNVHDNPELVSK